MKFQLPFLSFQNIAGWQSGIWLSRYSLLSIPLPISCHSRPWEVAVIAQIIGLLPLTWETWIEFMAPSFCLDQSFALQAFWKWLRRRKFSVSVYLYIFLCLCISLSLLSKKLVLLVGVSGVQRKVWARKQENDLSICSNLSPGSKPGPVSTALILSERSAKSAWGQRSFQLWRWWFQACWAPVRLAQSLMASIPMKCPDQTSYEFSSWQQSPIILAVRVPIRALTSQVRAPGCDTRLWHRFHLPTDTDAGRHQIMAPVIEFVHSQGTWVTAQNPSCGPVQPRPLQVFE